MQEEEAGGGSGDESQGARTCCSAVFVLSALLADPEVDIPCLRTDA